MLGKYKGTFDTIVAVKPTGWTFNSKKDGKKDKEFNMQSIVPQYWTKNITCIPLPYSEHSSFTELEAFVKALTPKIVIPTVNRSEGRLRRMSEILESWKK